MFLIVSLVLNVIILLLLLLMQGLALQVPVVLWCRLWRLLFVLLKGRRVRHIFNGDQTRIRAIHQHWRHRLLLIQVMCRQSTLSRNFLEFPI